MLPSSRGTCPSSTPSKTSVMNSNSLRVSRVTIHGAAVVYPAGATLIRQSVGVAARGRRGCTHWRTHDGDPRGRRWLRSGVGAAHLVDRAHAVVAADLHFYLGAVGLADVRLVGRAGVHVGLHP